MPSNASRFTDVPLEIDRSARDCALVDSGLRAGLPIRVVRGVAPAGDPAGGPRATTGAGADAARLTGSGTQAFDGLAALIADLSIEWSLSPREAAVLSAAARGKSTKEIAAELRVSRKTAEYFWTRLYGKMKCRSQLEAMAVLLQRALSGRRSIAP
jgi:DNA-binding CsgD family transcriptional regulator